MRLLLATALALGVALPALPLQAQTSVTLTLRNDGAAAVRCLLMLGHWVTQDVPVLAPGAATTLALLRQPEDGALYLLRADGRRRMMVETLVCGDDARWWETRSEVTLQPLREGAPHLDAACRLEQRLSCAATGRD